MVIALLLACSGPGPKPDTGARDTEHVVVDTDTGGDTARDTTVETDTDTGADTDTAPAGTDADGDGHVALANGGDDCDDANPYVYAGATEYCDTVDQDCDGDPMGDGLCNVPVPVAAAGRLIVELGPEDNPGAESRSGTLAATPMGDVTGDGVDDLARIRYYYGDSLVYAGGAWPAEPIGEEMDSAWHHFTGVDPTNTPVDAGDVNGDGLGDMVLINSFGGGYTIRWGPLEEGASSRLSNGATYWPDYFASGSLTNLASNIDFDGDGRTDMVAVDGSYVEPTVDITYAVYFGGDTHEECSLYADPWHTMAVVGDTDGDGLPESAWGDDEGVWIIPGADLRSACGGDIQTFASGHAPPLPDQWIRPKGTLGDWTGDGLDDWVVNGSDLGELGDEALWVLPGETALTSFTLDDAVGSWILTDGSSMYAEDTLDGGEGPLELLVRHAGAWYLLSSNTPLSIAAELPGTGYAIERASETYEGAGDFDGDGRDDLLFIERDSVNLEAYAWFVPGFDIPWDDPTRW